MEDIVVGRLMCTELVTVTPDTLVEEAATLMLEEGIGSVVVVDEDNQLEGILTSTDFVHIVSKSHPKAETQVERYMTTDVITASAHDTITDVASIMMEEGFHHMPVVDDGEGVIGMITTSDLTSYISKVQTPDPS